MTKVVNQDEKVFEQVKNSGNKGFTISGETPSKQLSQEPGVDHGLMESGGEDAAAMEEDRKKEFQGLVNAATDSTGIANLQKFLLDNYGNDLEGSPITVTGTMDSPTMKYAQRHVGVNFGEDEVKWTTQQLMRQTSDRQDLRTDAQKGFDAYFQDRVNRNSEIEMMIQESVDPMDTEKTKQFQDWMNKIVYRDNVLEVDGMWGVKSQEAFEEWKYIRANANRQFTGYDLEGHLSEYKINTSNLGEYEKQKALKELSEQMDKHRMSFYNK